MQERIAALTINTKQYDFLGTSRNDSQNKVENY